MACTLERFCFVLFCVWGEEGGGVLFADYVHISVFSREQQHVVTRRFCQVIVSKLGITASVKGTKAKAATRIICSCVRDYIHIYIIQTRTQKRRMTIPSSRKTSTPHTCHNEASKLVFPAQRRGQARGE